MARNREFDDELDALKMLHDAKNHDYATAENPYKNLEGVERIGIPAWKGIVIRLMDKFERVEQYCVNGELAIKSEGLEDTFKDIAVYSTLAMILFRKDQEKQQELTELERGKGSTDYGEPRFMSPKHLEPVDDKYNGDESYTHPMIAMREAAEKQQAEEKELCTICPNCGQENKNGVELGTKRENECSECEYKYYHGEALAHKKFFRTNRDN
jgi:ferredoxin-like protein FixX